MKKLFVTTLVAATMATGFAAQADAAEKPYKVYTKVQQVQLDQLDQEQVQKWLKEVCPSYKQPVEKDKINKEVEKKEEQADKQPTAPEKQPEVEQPKQEEGAPVQRPGTEAPEQPKQEENQTSAVSQEEQQMIDLVNQERSKQGLAPLKVNEELTKVARVKAQDMIDNNYFSHQSPTYGSPFEMLNQFGVEYRTAGENLAGNQSVEAAHQALMNSDGHRANILNSNYQEVGIGIIDGGSYGKMFVQLFKG